MYATRCGFLLLFTLLGLRAQPPSRMVKLPKRGTTCAAMPDRTARMIDRRDIRAFVTIAAARVS